MCSNWPNASSFLCIYYTLLSLARKLDYSFQYLLVTNLSTKLPFIFGDHVRTGKNVTWL